MKLRPFELALIIGFGFLGIGALILLATSSPSGEDTTDPTYVGPVQIWGTVPAGPMTQILSDLATSDEVYEKVSYRYIAPEEFNQTITESLADGLGPDLLFTSHEQLVEQRRRIRAIPFESFPLRDFQDLYIDGAQVHALADGVYGYPIMVDPLMMYWNEDILTNNGFLAAPRTWEELVNVQLPAMVDRSFDRTINRSVVAFGVYNNTKHAFGVLSMLLIQSGSNLVQEDLRNPELVQYDIGLTKTVVREVNPFANSLSFYLRFSQPANTLYSWNRSFGNDLTQFISEDLVFYFGYGSEGKEIQRLNPNLNFDIAEVPQGASADVRRTYGQFYALSPLRSSDNIDGAFKVMSRLSSDDLNIAIANNYSMVPTKRSLIALGSNDTFGRLSYRSAPITYGWLNPDRSTVDGIFMEMVSDVSENRNDVKSATDDAEQKLREIYD